MKLSLVGLHLTQDVATDLVLAGMMMVVPRQGLTSCDADAASQP